MLKSISTISLSKQALIIIISGIAACLLIFSIHLIGEYSNWKRLVKEHEVFMLSGKQGICKSLFQQLEQLEIDAGCRDKKFTQEDSIDNIFACDLRVQEVNPDLISEIEKNGCSTRGFQLVFRGDKNHPGEFLEWRASASIDYGKWDAIEISVFISFLLAVFFISINLWYAELHVGWKRLSLVVTGIGTVFSTWYAVTEFGGLERNFQIPLYTFIGLYTGMLLSRRIFQWVQDGFKSEAMSNSSNIPVVSDTSTIIHEPLEKPTPTVFQPDFESVEPQRANSWDRAFARCIDLIPALILGGLLAEILPSPSVYINGVNGFFADRVLWLFLNCAAIISYDTILMSSWGTTVGKSLFGIYIRTPEGAKLSLKMAFQRSMNVTLRGLWLMLFFPWIQIAIGYSLIRKGVTPWDFTGRGWTYQRNIGKPRRFLFATLGILFILAILVVQKVLKESARGDLLQIIL